MAKQNCIFLAKVIPVFTVCCIVSTFASGSYSKPSSVTSQPVGNDLKSTFASGSHSKPSSGTPHVGGTDLKSAFASGSYSKVSSVTSQPVSNDLKSTFASGFHSQPSSVTPQLVGTDLKSTFTSGVQLQRPSRLDVEPQSQEHPNRATTSDSEQRPKSSSFETSSNPILKKSDTNSQTHRLSKTDNQSRIARHHQMPSDSQKETSQIRDESTVPMTICGNGSGHSFTECLHEKCISPETVLQYYNISHGGIYSVDSYQPDIPQDVLQLVRHLCFHQTDQPTTDFSTDSKVSRHRKSTPAEAWGYGIGFVLIINCISMVGSVLVPIMDKPFYKKTLIFMVALGVGAMAGTSIFVLIPEAFDLMNIEEAADTYMWKSATVAAALFVFYVWEQAMRLQSEWRKQKSANKKVKEVEQQEMLEKGKPKSLGGEDSVVIEFKGGHDHGHSHGLSAEGGVATVAWIVLCADAIHKFVDGLSIGASFANSVATGVSVSVAILCEELPHELGDIAILVHSGMKMKKALLYNLLVSLPCLLGLAAGILLSEAVSADKWIFSIAGGVFMYIALVDMLPEIRTADEREPGTYKTLGSKVRLAILQDLGLLVGFLIILLLVTVF